jgi:hypothetical protein
MFCVVDTELPEAEADNHLMSLPAPPIKLSFRIRRNFVSRDWTSIGLRGARVTFGKARACTKLGSPGSGLSYTHTDEARVVGFVAPASNPSLDSSASPRRDWRGLLWIALIVVAIAAAATQVMK